MPTVFPLANYRTEFFKPSNGVETSLITVPTGFRYAVTGIRVCNSGGGTSTCIIQVERGAVEYTLNDALAISAGLPGVEEGFPLYLETGDILKATPSSTNQHVAVTYIRESQTTSGGPSR